VHPPESAVAFNLTCEISSHPFGTITSRQHNHEMLLSNTGQVTASPASPIGVNKVKQSCYRSGVAQRVSGG
jgi:hypothetical protein